MTLGDDDMTSTVTSSIVTEPRAWIGCLACYNEGNLSGRWLDADELQDLAETAELAEVFCPRPDHEELWVMDHEGLAASGEMSVQEASDRAQAIEQLAREADDRGIPVAVALAYVMDSNSRPEYWPDVAEAFHSSADDKADYVWQHFENAGWEPPAWLSIDYDGTFDDLTSGLSVYSYKGSLYIFE